VTDEKKTHIPKTGSKETAPVVDPKPDHKAEKTPTAGTTVIVKSGAPWKFVSVLFLLLVLAVSYIAWPLWGPSLPTVVRTLLSPVMDAGRTAAVTERVDALDKRIIVVEKDLTAVKAEQSRRIIAVENDLATVKAALATKTDAVSASAFSASTEAIKKIDAGQQVLASDVKSLSGRFNDIDKKIAALAAVPANPDAAKAIAALQANSSSKMASLEKENTTLQALIKDLGGRIAALETKPANSSGPGKSNALLLAVGQLRDTARTANGFAEPFATVEALAGGTASHKTALGVLRKHAAKGVPDLPILQRQFDQLSGDIVRASYTPAGDSWVDQTLFKISRLVTFRRTGEGGARKDDVAGMVARAELRLAAGDLKSAIGLVKKLPEGPRKVSQRWLKAAQSRLAVDRAISQLFQNALKGVGASGASGG